jgi:hypothetical protein
MSKRTPPNLATQPKKIKDFIAYVRTVCREYDIKLYLSKGQSIVYPMLNPQGASRGKNKAMGMGCWMEADTPGTRNAEPAKLSVATNRPRWQWLGTLAHELSHVMQWLECEPTYTCSMMKAIDEDASFVVEEWLEHKSEYDKRTIRKAVQITVDCELDNEKRTVAMIKKFKLPIDIKRYIQCANAYLLFHEVMFDRRVWYVKGLQSNVVMDQMPDYFLTDEEYIVGKMPKKYLRVIEKHGIKANGWNWKTRKRS